MHFVFEKYDSDGLSENFVDCPDINSSGIRRFTPSPFASALFRYKRMPAAFKEFAKDVFFSNNTGAYEKYIIATGVTHSPDDWCGPDYQGVGLSKQHANRLSLFAHLKEDYLTDLQTGRAFLLIDQSHEGYQVDWLWSWFHNNCDHYKINPKQIIYITGNLECKNQYNMWADYHNLKNRIFPIPYAHFEGMIFETAFNYKRGLFNSFSSAFKLPSAVDHIKYKKTNINNIKIYNALQKRPRAHRAWLFKSLYNRGLLECGINSMNLFEFNKAVFEGKHMTAEDYEVIHKLLPIAPIENPPGDTVDNFVSSDGGSYIAQLNENIMLDSWVTVVSEASFGDNDNTCFISEKTFKPIACSHPFIIFGNRHSLTHLKDMGYQTFSPLIDESYDNLPTWERLDAIIKELVKIKNMQPTERLEWFKAMQPILEHNINVFFRNNRSEVLGAAAILKNYLKG